MALGVLTPTPSGAADLDPTLTPLVSVEGTLEVAGSELTGPPAFSGNGDWVVYPEGRVGSTTLVRLHVPSGRTNQVAGPSNLTSPAISDNGSVVTYGALSSNGLVWEIHRWTASSGESETLSNDADRHAVRSSVSDSGDRVAWIEHPAPGNLNAPQVAVWTRDQGILRRPGATVATVSGDGSYVFFQGTDLSSNWRWELSTNQMTSVFVLGNVDDAGDVMVGKGRVNNAPGVLFSFANSTDTTTISMPQNGNVAPPLPMISGNGAVVSLYTNQDLITTDSVSPGWGTYSMTPQGSNIERLPLELGHRLLGWSDDGQTALIYEWSHPTQYQLSLLDLSPVLPDTPSEGDRPADDQILRLYQAVFGRSPDAAGAMYWRSIYRSGQSLITIAEDFQKTDEFRSRFGQEPSDSELVNGLYQNVFERSADTEGLSYWLGQLHDGMSRSELIVAFSDSQENITRTNTSKPLSTQESSVLRLYQAALGRFPDAGGFLHWTGAHRGGVSLEAIAASMIASPEGQSKYGDGLDDAALVHAMYHNVLDRSADEDGLLYWLERRANGLSAEALIVAFSNSEENLRRTGTAP